MMIEQILQTNIKFGSENALEDFSDKLSSTTTVYLLLVMSTLISYKTYFIPPMECYIPTSPSGTNFDAFVANVCWTNGTFVVNDGQDTPTVQEYQMNKYKTISYYVWIPVILGIQCALFYIPKIMWRDYCIRKAGTDLKNLIEMSMKAANSAVNSRAEITKDIAGIIDALFHLHRHKGKVQNTVPFLVWGKRSGNNLMGMYLLFKFLLISVAFVQLFLMIKVLQLNESFWAVFYQVFDHMLNGAEWKATVYFPRVTFCYITDVRSLGMRNNYLAQCALPINILNEKVYIFLFLWMTFLILFSGIDLLKWIYVIVLRRPKRKLIKRYLTGRNIYKKVEASLIDKFLSDYLRLDGLFLIKMIRIRAGDVVTSSIVEQLWSLYKTKYRNADASDQNLTLRLQPGETKVKSTIPSAPEKKEMFF